MITIHTIVVASCIVLVVALRTPPRTLNIHGAIATSETASNVESITDNKQARNIGSSRAQDILKAETDALLSLRKVEVTTYAPRPTTSMPQSRLRSLCLTPRGKFSHPLDCRKYVDCWDGRVLEKRCPNDLVFSDLPGEFCDYLEYVDCGTRPVLLDANEKVQAPELPALPVNPPASTTTTAAPRVIEIKWTASSNGNLPPNAVAAGGQATPNGNDGSIFVGRALVDGNVIPCALEPKAKGCHVSWGNKEILYSDYEVLQTNGGRWISMSSDAPIPPTAIPTGLLDINPIQRMYTGRAWIENDLVPGYLSENNRMLVHSRDGVTYFTSNYEILVK